MDDDETKDVFDRSFALEAALKAVIDLLIGKGYATQKEFRDMFEGLQKHYDQQEMFAAVLVFDELLHFVGSPRDPASREQLRRLAKGPTDGKA